MDLTVWAHESSDSNVYMDPSLLNAKEGDFAQLWVPKSTPLIKANTISSTPTDSDQIIPHQFRRSTQISSNNSEIPHSSRPMKELRKNFYFQISKPAQNFNSAKISLNPTVISTLKIRRRQQVRVRLISTAAEMDHMTLDVVEIHFKAVHLTRHDQYRIGKTINNHCVSVGQRLRYLCDSLRLTVTTLYRGGKKKFSGYIGDDTRVVFRSDSSRILIFVHMSSEMWNFDETGDIMFHRLVNSFIPEMLVRWHAQGDSHLISLILFTSICNTQKDQAGINGNKPVQGRLRAGELEKDTKHFYRIVVDTVHISRWTDIMCTLRAEFERFPKEVLEDPDTHKLRGYFLPSSKSNILEALSLATTLLTSKFIDRDLCRTGVQAMAITAGPACFDVDLGDLWQLSRRLLGVEVGIELVCLARPPLHITPLFRALLPDISRSEERDPCRLVFCVPTWINISFWSSPDTYRKQWIPRCRIYDLQMVGLIENDTRILGLKSYNFEPNEITNQFMRQFDACVFKSKEALESQKRIKAVAETADLRELQPRNRDYQKKSLASVITTIATATSTPNFHYDETVNMNHGKQLNVHRSDKNSKQNARLNLFSNENSRDSALRSLGALLGSGKSQGFLNVDKFPHKVISFPRFNSLNSQSIHAASENLSSRDTISRHLRYVSGDNSDFTRYHEHPELSKISMQEPIYIKNRTGHDRSDSKVNSMKVSPVSRFSGSSKFNTKLRGESSSPKKDWHNNSLQNSNLARAGCSALVCDTSKPEFQHESMWRVLQTSATIDNPTRVEAYGRWANVYPPKIKINGVSWHSLKSPASLPLTSEAFPTLSDFQKQYKFQFYDIAVDQDEINIPQILDEMIGLRLQMGFQIAVGANVKAIEASLPSGNPNRVIVIVPREKSQCIGIRMYMTRRGLIHRLAVDDDMRINVSLYTWLESSSRMLSCPINNGRIEEVKVKTKYSNKYTPISKKFLDQGIEHLNWSVLDQQLIGTDDPLLYPSSANLQNLVTIRYVLVPTEVNIMPSHQKLTAEEGHVEGISRFVRTLLKYREAGPNDSDFFVHFYTGKLSKAIEDIVLDSASKLGLNRLNKSISLKDLAIEMQGPMGLKFRDRRWHWKQFTQVFTGDDFVIWAMKTFEDISSIEEAEVYGADLMYRGLFKHPENRHPFLQGHYFYTLTPQYKQDYSGSVNSRSVDNITSLDDGKSEDDQSKKHEGKLATVHVSESFVINVDVKRIADRPERAKISIDRMHNPKNAFHVIVEWLNVTPRLVDDLFSGMGRMVTQYGLRLIQVPVADVCGSIEDSPFRSAMLLKVNIDIDDAEERRWFRHYLLRRQGYVLDIHDRRDVNSDKYEVLFLWGRLKSSLPQYIHSSGYVLVQMDPDGNFYVTPNSLHISRSAITGNALHNADGECENLMNHLLKLCNDTEALKDLLVEARHYKVKAKEFSVKIIKNHSNGNN